MPVKTYSNAPSPKLLEKIGATNLTLADAIAEIVANSFDSASDGLETLVEVSVAPERILVTDNGMGMEEKVLVEAVKLGVDMADVVAKKERTKGKFGLGMKTACASMGRWWGVYTRPKGSDKEYRVAFDLADWQKRQDSSDAWRIDIEERDADGTGPLGDRPHGTAIEVKKLRSKDPMAGAVRKKLGESFKPHLEQGHKILINGDPAAPHIYDFVAGSKVEIDIKFGEADKYNITGWVAIDTQTHNDGQYGFNIYRRDQLVQTWNQDWFPGHLMTSRIVGEVHMDFIDATFFKQGLQQSDLWNAASEKMKEFMRPVVKASRDLSQKRNITKPSIRTEVVRQLRDTLGLDPAGFAAPADADGGADATNGRSAAPAPSELIKLQIEAEKLVLPGGTGISLSRTERAMGPESPAFDYIADSGDPVGLQTVINLDHPLVEKSNDLPQLRQIAAADSIMRYLIDVCDYESRKAVEVRNRWLLEMTADAVEAAAA